MAKAKQCDRCGNYFQDNGVRPEVRVIVEKHYFEDTTPDLCASCRNQLIDWLGGGAELEPPPRLEGNHD